MSPVRRLPEQMSLYLYLLRERRYRAMLLQNFLLNSFEQPAGVACSPFGPVQHPLARYEMDSECLRSLSFQVKQFDSLVAMKQPPDATRVDLQGLASAQVAGLPLVKNPAHLPERQLPSVFVFHEPTC